MGKAEDSKCSVQTDSEQAVKTDENKPSFWPQVSPINLQLSLNDLTDLNVKSIVRQASSKVKEPCSIERDRAGLQNKSDYLQC